MSHLDQFPSASAAGAMASMEFEVSWNGATEKVAVLTSSSAAEQAATDISETSETTIVGFDTEWGSKG